MPTEPAPRLPLSAWLQVFCPVYRGALIGLVALNLLSAVGVFIELQLLRALTVALSGPLAPSANVCTVGQWAQSGFSFQPEPCGASLPAFLLVIYAVSILAQSAVDLLAYTFNSRLAQRARRDVERELLSNLLRQDDAFYVRRSPAEIVSRLGGDLQRVGARRQNFTEGSATALTILATLLVLVSQSWLAAAIGLAISLIGVASAEPRMRKLRQLDRETTLSDERVKAAFEDTLQGAAEIQVSGALPRMLARFGALQKVRDVIALSNAGLNNRNVVAQKLTFTLGFIAIVALFVFTHLFGQPGGGATAGLIVLLVSSLPELYFKFAEMTQRFTQYRIAGESVRRLMQYEAAPKALSPAPAADSDAIRLTGVRYVFSGGDSLQGGPQGLNGVIPGRGMTGIVGAAGSGKSTLVKLILDRQPHVAGSIALPAAEGRPLFAYLPQRPVLFDATIGDNLFLGDPPADPLARVASAESLARLGLIDLIRIKGLDARPRGALAAGLDIAALRREFRSAAESALGAPLKTLGAEVSGPRQMAIERQLGLAVDQEAFARHLAGDAARAIVTAMSGLSYGAAMAALAGDIVRATAPLLAKATDPAEYNTIATFTIEPPIFTLRRMALEMASNGGPPGGATSPLLVAIGLSVKLEELQGGEIPPAGEAREKLAALVEGLSEPLDEGRLNRLLPWRENLIFAAPDGANSRDTGRIDHALIARLAGTPLDSAVIGAGFDYAVGRQGGRLSGGQQQMIGLGRVLLTQARFLVLDEPSSAFHPQLRQMATQALRREAETRGVIVITHDIDLARACDRLIFVRDGSIVGEGRWDELLASADGFSAWVAESGARS